MMSNIHNLNTSFERRQGPTYSSRRAQDPSIHELDTNNSHAGHAPTSYEPRYFKEEYEEAFFMSSLEECGDSLDSAKPDRPSWPEQTNALVHPMEDRTLPAESTLEFPVQWARDQLRNCRSHRNYNWQTETDLPKRVIDVGLGDGSESPHLRLLETEESGQLSGRYLALSYCWGPPEKNYRTTAENVEKLKNGIQWDDLPQTIQDAINITRRLHVRYLWVDALCIIQGPGGDWNAESNKMGATYGGALLTICAASGWDVSHGLRRSFDSPMYLGDEPLYRRAWTLQERMLSPRVLIIGTGTLYWECQACDSTFFAEGGAPFPRSVRPRLSDSPTVYDWHGIVEDYTSRLLSVESDKLLALAGVASAYEMLTKKKYLAGLWRESLLEDLLWWQTETIKRGNHVAPSVPKDCRAPSWSWASLDGNIKMVSIRRLDWIAARVIDTYCHPDDYTPIFTEQDGVIQLEGPLLKTLDGMNSLSHVDISLDFRCKGSNGHWTNKADAGDLSYLLLGVDSTWAQGLVLVKKDDVSARLGYNVYKRVGIFCVTMPKAMTGRELAKSLTKAAGGMSLVHIV